MNEIENQVNCPICIGTGVDSSITEYRKSIGLPPTACRKCRGTGKVSKEMGVELNNKLKGL
jgi:DnaJ-class molecular chaperone